ncbi:biotin transporter BioY [[Limnothrix rosea] IAM M-220]|uniref:biotin transporter BioY n=1 Tax=[Limnothrix rosea] IAM M-220 TaxID=454133 RepID=UPI0009667695|nr:biotin transporter BioY [[Limnothrix rosea] IAM M-220]OKH16876.1 biotin transporter BioY [[Limnothrix rosea] IAM M-220]
MKSTLRQPPPKKKTTVSAPNQFLWALIGVLLTIGGTFIEAHVTTSPPWTWTEKGIAVGSLGIYCQVGAVLLTGCLGGKNAGVLSQIAYIFIGLFWLPVFTQGGKLAYVMEPTFGYILGFIPGAWVCGWLAFRYVLTLESLALSAFCGLLVVHLSGVLYLTGMAWLERLAPENITLGGAIALYTLQPFAGQLVLVCGVAFMAYCIRRILFY